MNGVAETQVTVRRDYRLGEKPGESQANGFFIDEEFRILYWPTKQGPGYHVSFDESQKIAEVWRGIYYSLMEMVKFTLIVIAVAVLTQLSQPLYDGFFHRFFDLKIYYTITSATLMSVAVATYLRFWVRPRFLKRIEYIFVGKNPIEQKRPEWTRRKPSEKKQDQHGGTYVLFLFCGVFGLAVVAMAIDSLMDGSGLLGDNLFALLFGISFELLVAYLIWFEVVGLNNKDIHYYDQECRNGQRNRSEDIVHPA